MESEQLPFGECIDIGQHVSVYLVSSYVGNQGLEVESWRTARRGSSRQKSP